MGKHIIGHVQEFLNGKINVVTLEGKSIGVVYTGGEFYALRNLCPHQGGPACGGIFPTLKAMVQPNGRIKEYNDYDEPVVACPWHGWEFDVKTGECLADRSRRIAVYETSVEEDTVIVTIP
jgi:nitrite reductase (NADH) small subunit